MVSVADVEKDARTQPHAVALASVQASGILHVPVTEHGRIVALLLLKRSWPEKDQRRREWMAPEDAAVLVAEPGLADILLRVGSGPNVRTV